MKTLKPLKLPLPQKDYAGLLRRSDVPEHLQPGLVRYLGDGIRPGGFLCAVLANDLAGAVSRADGDSAKGLVPLVRFLFDYAPVLAWGSTEAVENWIDAGNWWRRRDKEQAGGGNDETV